MRNWSDPFEEMDNAMNDWFGDFFGDNTFSDLSENTFGMKTDVIEEDHDYKLQADLPGFNKEDIHIDLKNGVLNIQASHSENKDEKDEETGKYIRHERGEASYSRSFHVGEQVTPEDINAAYENGVLTLTFPKQQPRIEQEEAPKQIEVH